MLCTSCVHWTVELFSYSALEERWTKLIGNVITPGYKDKFIKESEKQSLDFDNTYLSFKYCSKGCLDRFYIMRNPRDDKPKEDGLHMLVIFNFCSCKRRHPCPRTFVDNLHYRIPWSLTNRGTAVLSWVV